MQLVTGQNPAKTPRFPCQMKKMAAFPPRIAKIRLFLKSGSRIQGKRKTETACHDVRLTWGLLLLPDDTTVAASARNMDYKLKFTTFVLLKNKAENLLQNQNLQIVFHPLGQRDGRRERNLARRTRKERIKMLKHTEIKSWQNCRSKKAKQNPSPSKGGSGPKEETNMWLSSRSTTELACKACK